MYEENQNSPFLQRFINDLPAHLRNEKIKVVSVQETNLSPKITLEIAETNYVIIHELKSGKTRVFEDDHEILNSTNAALFIDFIEDIFK